VLYSRRPAKPLRNDRKKADEDDMVMDEPREVMNIRQASEYLGISTDTLYKYVSEEKIPAFKLGNRWRFKKSRLDQWMDEQSTMTGPVSAKPSLNPSSGLRPDRKRPKPARMSAAGTR
jgi:excisionase family DNA binding protein